jgi:hypothetical protein
VCARRCSSRTAWSCSPRATSPATASARSSSARRRSPGSRATWRVREIVLGVFKWGEGQFHFEESALPEKERITVDLDVTALILEGLRRLEAGSWVRARHPDGHLVLERGQTSAEGLLRPYEDHVLNLIDGDRSVIEICHESEVGDNQTLKLLYAFVATDIARGRGRKVRTLDQDFVPEDTTYSVLESFNRMYRFIFA